MTFFSVTERFAMFLIFSDKVTNGFVFLNKTHFEIGDEKKLEDEFKGRFFFSHGKLNSCRVLIGYYGTKRIEVIIKKCHNSEGILLLEINIDDSLFVLINIYDANNEPDQVKTLTDVVEILDSVGGIQIEIKLLAVISM